MFFFKTILYFVSFANTYGNYSFYLNRLIEKIHLESDSENLCFIGINNEFLSNFTKEHSNIQVLIVNSMSSEEYKEIAYTLILVVQVSQASDSKFSRDMLNQFIPTLRVRNFVIVSSNNFEELHDYFQFFEENKFSRIFGIANDTAYAYFPYANNRIQTVQFDVKLPDVLRDLNGFSFRTTVERNIPRTFWYTTKGGKRKKGGCFGQIFLAFIRRHNATYKEIIISNSSDIYIPGIINATLNNQIDISMNAYGRSEGLDCSYPVKVGRMSVMVPLNGYVNPNEYFKRPFSPTVWILIGITLIYLVLMDVIVKMCTNMPVDLWCSFTEMFLAMIGLPRERAVKTAYRLHILVFILAFILVNFYIISFTSFLTVYIKVKQFETLQDLIDNNFNVMLVNFVWGAIAKSGLYPAGFENIVTTVDSRTYLKEMYSMKNTSFAYGLGSDTSEFLIKMQGCFAKPLFHMTRDSLLGYYIGFLMVRHSPFKEILNDFIFHVMETGLIEKWDRDVVFQARYSGIKELDVHREDMDTPQDMHVALTVHHLIFCWNLLALGWTTAVLIFFGELFSRIVKPKTI